MTEVTEQDDISQDEPQTELPESASREDTYNAAESEGVEDAILETLAGKADVTIEDLRQIPGADKYTDEQLLEHWAKAKGGESVEGETKVDLPFPVYDAQGNKVSKDNVTLEALLKGDLQLGYQAMGKEQRKSLTDVIRNASQGHWNEHRYTTVQGQLTDAIRQLRESQGTVEKYTTERGQWNAALTALIAGDKGPMQRLVDAYQQALTTSGAVPPGFVSQESVRADAENVAAGQQWMNTVAMPAAMEIAQRYDAKANEVLQQIEYLISIEPVLTQERLNEIIQFDVPMAFEANGYKAKTESQSNGAGTNDVAELRRTVEALQKRLAGAANGSTERTRQKVKNAPAAGSGSVSGAGDSVPSFKSRAQFKAWSQGDPDWAKV